MRKYKLILFDFDGTLMDTSPGIIHSMQEMLKALNLPQMSPDTIRSHIGPPAANFFDDNYDFPPKIANEMATTFERLFKSEDFLNANLYAGMDNLLPLLSSLGYLVGIATNKPFDHAMALLDHFGLSHFFDVVSCGDEDSPTKKDVIQKAIHSLHVDKSQTILFGDSKYDAEGAELAGIDFAAVTYGFGFTSDNDVKKYNHIECFHSVFEIQDYFKSIE